MEKQYKKFVLLLPIRRGQHKKNLRIDIGSGEIMEKQ